MSLDPHRYSVSLHLHCDGTNASTTITDSSSLAHVMTAENGAQITTSDSVFGGASLSLVGTNRTITAPSNAAFDFGSGDFTIELHYKSTQTTTGWIFGSYARNPQSNSHVQWLLRGSGTNLTIELCSGGAAEVFTIKANAQAFDGNWHSIAVVRSGNTVHRFFDGVLEASDAYSSTLQTPASQILILGGVEGTFERSWSGLIDEVRVTKGVAHYTSSYTPPTAAFTDEGLILATVPVLAPSPSVIAHGGGSVSIQSPLPLMYAGIEFSANSDLQCPSPLITVLAGGTVSATAPSPSLLSIARDSTGDYAASLTAPRPTLTAFGAATALATAPKPTLASGGTVAAMGSASVASPSVLVQSEGRVSAMVRADLRAPSASLIGYGGAVVSVTLSGKATVEASGTTGGIAGASLKCPLFQLSAEATAQNYGSASLIAPSPEIGRTVQAWVAAPAARLTAIGTAVVTATFDAYVVNLLHRGGSTVDEVTHYTNFPFTHVVRYQNSYYGVNGTGLYLLEGTTDDGDPIEWAVQTAMEDFGSPRRKTVDSVYIEGRLGAATTVSLQSGEKAPNTYSHTTPRGATAQNHRQKLGRGVKERYHALCLAGDGEFELDAVEFNERETNRRI